MATKWANDCIMNRGIIGNSINDVLERENVLARERTESLNARCNYSTLSTHLNVLNRMITIKNVIFNDPATIVFWADGTKTVVKCQDGEEFDPEKGITMAFFKKMHGNKGSYFNEIKKWVEPYCEEEKERSVRVAEMLASLRALVDRMSKPETSDD